MRTINSKQANQLFLKASRIAFTDEEDAAINSDINEFLERETPASLARVNGRINKKIKHLNTQVEKLVELRSLLYAMTVDISE